MGKKLTATQVARYERDGLLFPLAEFSRAEARRYRFREAKRDETLHDKAA